MAIVRVVEMALDQVIDMVAVRDGFVATVWSVGMLRVMTAAVVPVGAIGRVRSCHFELVLVDVAFMRVVEVTVVQEVDMAVVLDGCVAAVAAVLVGVVGVDAVLGGHGDFLSGLCSVVSV